MSRDSHVSEPTERVVRGSDLVSGRLFGREIMMIGTRKARAAAILP